MVDGRQYLLVPSGSALTAFALPQQVPCVGERARPNDSVGPLVWLAWLRISRRMERLAIHRLVRALGSCGSADQAAQEVGPHALVRG